jgi:hypothetical protein
MNTPVILRLPEQLDEAGALDFAQRIFGIGRAGKYQLDFSPLKFARPLGTLLLASELRQFFSTQERSFTATGIDAGGRAAHSYLAHVGFFKGIGLPIGNRPGEATGSSTYVPIRVLTRLELEAAARASLSLESDRARFGVAIQQEASKLAALVTGDRRPLVNSQITYCLREVIRNVFEHGRTNQCTVQAQLMTDGYVEVAISDRGCGILTSLSGRLGVSDDTGALQAAVQPGVSGAPVDDDDGEGWANSGYGLYVLSEIGKRYGSFALFSGSSVLRTDGDGAAASTTTHRIAGTAVGLKFRQLKKGRFDAELREIVRAGERLAAEQGRHTKASMSTRLSVTPPGASDEEV